MGITIKLGVAPTKRDYYFDSPKKYENKKAVQMRLDTLSDELNFTYVDLDDIIEDGMLCEMDDVAKIKSYFLRQEIDALFVPFTNFGQEETVGKLAKAMGLPLLLWGPRDGAPDGYNARETDTQCGLFAVGKVLSRYGIKFSYIENSYVDSEIFKEGLRDFLSVIRMLKMFNNLRIGQISVRPRQFLSVMSNEGMLLEKFGIELVPINAVSVINDVKKRIEKDKAKLRSIIDEVVDAGIDTRHIAEDKLFALAAIEESIREYANQHGCTALASECWSMFQETFGIEPCFAFGNLSDKGLPMACENDIHGAVSSALAYAAVDQKSSVFLADLTIRHPQNDNSELLWHCGPFPKSLKKAGCPAMIDDQGHGTWEIKGGTITVIRFDELLGEYSLFADTAKGTQGPVTCGNYLWIEVDDWAKWEKKFVYGPYIHHVSGVYGDYTELFKEFCRYQPQIKYDNVGITI